MPNRKIQLIAGTTYSVSLPKEWVRKNKLQAKDEVSVHEKNDSTLVISHAAIERQKMDEISLDIDEYISSIDHVLFAAYNLGFEKIRLFSKEAITKDLRTKIRKTLNHMSGTEIRHEDKHKITIKVLLDKSKVDAMQIFYRISLILQSSISNIVGEFDIKEIRVNEDEIDRLYHLMAKIISLALIDPHVLHTSNIKNVSLIPSYFLISKRLENIADCINHLGEYLYKKHIKIDSQKDVLNFIKEESKKSIKHILKADSKMFEKVMDSKIKGIKKSIEKCEDVTIKNFLEEIMRYMVDVEDEVVHISFYNKLIAKNIL